MTDDGKFQQGGTATAQDSTVATVVDQLSGDSGITTWPASAAPANGVSLAEALRWLIDQIAGANGVVTFPAAAAPANGVSLAEVIAALYNDSHPAIATGTITITDARQTESTPFSILTITPAAGAPLKDVEVWLDLAKASTGFAAVETSITAQFAPARKVDGTNYRREAYQEAALSGTLAAGRMAKITFGTISVTELAKLYAVFSADITGDIEIPYAVAYKGMAAPTIA